MPSRPHANSGVISAIEHKRRSSHASHSHGTHSFSSTSELLPGPQPQLSECLLKLHEAETALYHVRAALTKICDPPQSRELAPEIATAAPKSPAKPSLHTHRSVMSGKDVNDFDDEVTRLLIKEYNLSEENLATCHGAFDRVQNDERFVDIKDLRRVLTEVTGSPFSKASLDKLLVKLEIHHRSELDFNDFLKIYCHTPLQRMQNLEHMIEAVGTEARNHLVAGRMPPQQRVIEVGVPRHAVKHWIRKEIVEATACFQLPLAASLFVAFCFAVFLHFRTDMLHAVDNAISLDIEQNANFAFVGALPFGNGRMGHKNYNDVNTFADFWSWMNLGITPLFFPTWDISEARANANARCASYRGALYDFGGWKNADLSGIPNVSAYGGACPEANNTYPNGTLHDIYGDPGWKSKYLIYHTIIGGVRMRQERSSSCRCPAGNAKFAQQVATGSCLMDEGYWLEPELHQGMVADKRLENRPGGETVYLLSMTSQSDIRQLLRKLEDQVWMHPATAKVELMLVTYNAHLDCLTATFIYFYLNRGGHIHKTVEPISIWMTAYPSWWNYVADVVWILLVMQIFITEGIEVFKYLKQLGIVEGLKTYLCIDNAIDWLSVMCSFAIVGLWFNHVSRLMKLREYMERASTMTVGSFESPSDREEFFQYVDDTMGVVYFFRMLLAMYPFVVGSRFFKAFAYQPRLAMVTNTLRKASTDILHFMVIFGTIFTLYASSAMILFGQEIMDFANFGRAATTIFRIMLGDFTWNELTRVGRLRANLWFWSFMWLVQLIMLNMLLAIVMDVYTDLKGSMGSDAETLWSQSVEIWKRWRAVRAGRELSIEHILECLDPKPLASESKDDLEEEQTGHLEPLNGTMLTVSRLQEICPELTEKQALSVLVSSYQTCERQSQELSTSLSDTALNIQYVRARLEETHKSVEHLVRLSELSSTLITSTSESNKHIVEETHANTKCLTNVTAEMDTMASVLKIQQTIESLLRDQVEQQRLSLDNLSQGVAQLSGTSSPPGLPPDPRRLAPMTPSTFNATSDVVALPNESPQLFARMCATPELSKKDAFAHSVIRKSNGAS